MSYYYRKTVAGMHMLEIGDSAYLNRLHVQNLAAEADAQIKCLGAMLARREMQAAELQLENAECVAAQRDAERYRHFKYCFTHPGQLRELAKSLGVHPDEFLPSLDAAIDEAIATGAAK